MKKFFKFIFSKLIKFFKFIKSFFTIRRVLLLIFALIFSAINFKFFLIFIGLYFGVSLIYRFYNYTFNEAFIYNAIHSSNTLLSGFKGKGKDLITQGYVIRQYSVKFVKVKNFFRRIFRKPLIDKSDQSNNYISNIDYGHGCNLKRDLNYFSLFKKNGEKITFKDFVNLHNMKGYIDKNNDLEGMVILISDGGIYLPSHEYKLLDQIYPDFPIFFALARQLYNARILINTQDPSRVWNKLREQQDTYLRADGLKFEKGFFGKIKNFLPYWRNKIFVTVTYYEKLSSLEEGLAPFKGTGALNKAVSPVHVGAGYATKEVYEASNGVIKKKTLIIDKRLINYDTRAFHEYLFGYKFD